ncbi:MAG: hypothetical protein DMG80_09295 [Acidobacteria bacterium]|nr:MAG: hypothetical protein DMG80_09295 [Acidobacteriota bacterium]
MKIPITSKGCHPERSENIREGEVLAESKDAREVRSIPIASGNSPCAHVGEILHCVAETDFVSEFPRLSNCFPSRARNSAGGDTFTSLQTPYAEPLA